jgi:hypothetical protein
MAKGILVDPYSFDRIAQVTRHVERANRGSTGGVVAPSGTGDGWYSFVNTYAGTIPACGCVKIDESEPASQAADLIYQATRPDTEFGLYAINGPTDVATGGTGFLRFDGRTLCLYESPGFGFHPDKSEGYGPKPGSFELGKGYPCLVTAHKAYSESSRLLLGTLGEIGEVFGKPQSDIAAATDATTPNTGTVIVQYFDGTEYQATTFELTGTNILPYKIKAGRLYKWVAVGDQWCAVELASRSWAGTIAGSVAAGATATVTLSDGTSHTGTNVSGQQLEAGAVLATDDAYTGDMLISGAALPETGGGGSGIAAYRAILTAALSAQSTTASINTITAFDGGSTPAISSVNNWFDKSGYIGDEVIFVPSTGLGGTNYTIIDVSRPDIAQVIEGYVYEAFSKSHQYFRGAILRAYQGSMPTGLGMLGNTLMIYNFDREGVTPNDNPDAKPYLFEGAAGAAWRAEYDPDNSKFLGIHVYRATWVECPDESPVETEGGGTYMAQQESSNYGYGGQSPLVAPYYGG